jgi:hypothetical protein
MSEIITQRGKLKGLKEILMTEEIDIHCPKGLLFKSGRQWHFNNNYIFGQKRVIISCGDDKYDYILGANIYIKKEWLFEIDTYIDGVKINIKLEEEIK